jgi:hypothetical protein
MLTEKWKQVNGFSNMGESDENIFAKKKGDNVLIAYMAYGGLKIFELAGVDDVGDFSEVETDFSAVISSCGDDWEVALPVMVGALNLIIAVDDCGGVDIIEVFSDDGEDKLDELVSAPEVIETSEFDSDEIEYALENEDDLVDEDLIRAYNLV